MWMWYWLHNLQVHPEVGGAAPGVAESWPQWTDPEEWTGGDEEGRGEVCCGRWQNLPNKLQFESYVLALGSHWGSRHL